MRTKLFNLLAASLLVFVLPSQAHHSASAAFDLGKTVGIEGVVTEVWFENPHSRYYVEVEKGSGEKELWEIGTMSPNWFLRRGWDEETVQVGNRVKVQGHPARDGSNRMALRGMTREGVEIYSWSSPGSPFIKNL